MASTERLRVSRNRWANRIGPRLISINLEENIAGHFKTAGKSGKRIERCVISTFQIGQSLATTVASFAWKHLLRVGE